MVNFSDFLKLIFCYVAALCDLVHNVEAIYSLCLVLTASGNSFRNMSDARHFQMLLAVKEGEI